MAQLPREILRLLADSDEMDVETPSGLAGPGRRTTVWPVVVGGALYVRSWRARRGRWYRDLLAHSYVDIVIEGQRIAVASVEVADAVVLEAVSRAFEQKYAGTPFTRDMMRPEALPTTARLDPR